MIYFSTPPAAIHSYPATSLGALPQAAIKSGKSVTSGEWTEITFRGRAADVKAIYDANSPGDTSAPEGFAAAEGTSVKLADAQYEGEEGGLAACVLRYEPRSPRETDADMQAGLLSRTSSYRFIERQEAIENFASRASFPGSGASGGFDPQALELWRAEEDAEAKAAYKYHARSLVGGRAELAAEPAELSGVTRAIAQRVNIGVEYVPSYVCELAVVETWRVAPEVDWSDASIVPGIPEKYRPLFTSAGASAGDYAWIRLRPVATQLSADRFQLELGWLGIPATSRPSPAPDYWGDKAADAMLYGGDGSPDPPVAAHPAQ